MSDKGNFEQVGLESVFAGLDQFKKDIRSYLKNVDSVSKQTQKAADETKKSGKRFGVFGKVLGVTGKVAKGFAGILKNVVVGALLAVRTALIAATGGILLVVGAFPALAKEASVTQGVMAGFEREARRAGIGAKTFLAQLEEAAGGTIDSTRLMQLANGALLNTSQELSQEFGEKLPAVLMVARKAAQDTGEDVEFLFESLVEGIRKGSAERIDNARIVLTQGEAERRYAEQLGVSVDQLSSSQKQIAILNETLIQAGVDMETLTLEMSEQEMLSVQLARSGAMMNNVFGDFAMAILPALSTALSVVNGVLANVHAWVLRNSDLIGFFANIMAGIFRKGVMIAGHALNIFKDAFVALGTFLIENRMAIARGAANVFAALGNAILWAANNIVLPAVEIVADGIAAFLVGESPPPKGALSQIDKGGRNTMTAWLDGFASASLEPVKKVAGQVSNAMGNVANLSLEQVEMRLKQLDLAVRPFEERLKLVKDRFEALQKPAQAALNSIERQLETAVKGLTESGAGLDRVRQLQEQQAQIQGALDLEKQRVDNAQIQLALAKSQQQQERTILEIQQNRLKGIEKENKTQLDGIKKRESATKKAAKPKGGAGAPQEAGGTAGQAQQPSGGFAFDPSEDPLVSLTGEQRETRTEALARQIGEAGGEFSDVFASQFDTGALDEAQGRVTGIGETFSAIGQANIGQRIGDALGGIGDIVTENVIDPFNNMTDTINSALDDLPNTLTNNLVVPFQNSMTDLNNAIFGDEESIKSFLENLPNNIMTWLTESGGGLSTIVDTYLKQPFIGAFDAIKERVDGAVDNSLAFLFTTLPVTILVWLMELSDTLHEALVQPFINKFDEIKGALWENEDSFGKDVQHFFTGQGEGTLQGILDTAKEKFRLFVEEGIPQAFAALGNTLWSTFVEPVVEALNWMVNKLEEWLNVFVNGAGSVVNRVPGFNIEPVELGEFSIQRPAFLTGAATGGIFSGGLLRVGERGQEIVGSAQPMGVMNNRFVNAMDKFSGVMENSFVGGGGMGVNMPLAQRINSNTSNDNSITVNQSGANMNPADVAMEIAIRRIFE